MKKFGWEAALEALQHVDKNTQETILKNVSKLNKGVALGLKMSLFRFEDIKKINPKSFEVLFKNTPSNLWPIALRGASKELLIFIFSNMTQRRAEQIKSEMDCLGPQIKSQSIETQQKIIQLAIQLEKEGKLNLNISKEDPLI